MNSVVVNSVQKLWIVGSDGRNSDLSVETQEGLQAASPLDLLEAHQSL